MVEQTQVIICGGGPTGAVLSALLGRANVPNIVLERDAAITTDPRGVALDEDGIRVLQAIGVYDKIFTDIASPMESFNFVTGVHSDLYKRPMLSVDHSTSEGGTGHVGFIRHKQPAMEKAIRDSIACCPASQFRSSSTVTGIDEDEKGVTISYTDVNGHCQSLRGKFLVGTDGKTGYVRKKYLEPRGITMDRCEGTNYEEVWVALNWKINLPNEKSHPDFPLWRMGYTPLEVYDLFFPLEFRFLCNPDRPAVCGRFGLPDDRLWRFEFVVQKGEDAERMASWEETTKIIFPYLTHSGSRYGLQQPVTFPADCIEVLRSRPFGFQARSCNKWSLGRVLLAGDAAHVFPPFGGQGIASGFRDAMGLAWRLTLLHREPEADYDSILRAWWVERKQQFDRSLAATVRNGEFVTERDPVKVFIRDWQYWFMQLIPSWRRELEKGPRAAGMMRYKHQPGLPFLSTGQGGLLLPQVYAFDFEANRVKFSDDLIFMSSKMGLLQLVLLPRSVQQAKVLLSDAKSVLRDDFVLNEDITVLIQDETVQPYHIQELVSNGTVIARVATGEEFGADPILCRNRPKPKYYNPKRMLEEVNKASFIIVRPDRVIYSACHTRKELANALATVREVLLS